MNTVIKILLGLLLVWGIAIFLSVGLGVLGTALGISFSVVGGLLKLVAAVLRITLRFATNPIVLLGLIIFLVSRHARKTSV